MILDFLIDKLLYLPLLFEKSDELNYNKNNYEYSKYFLSENNAEFDKRYAKTLRPMIEALGGDQAINSIYLIKSIISADKIYKKMEDLIGKKRYALIQFYEIDTSRMDNFDLFNSKNLRIYLINKDDLLNRDIVLTEVYKGELRVKKIFETVKCHVRIFKGRQLVYSKVKGFVSI